MAGPLEGEDRSGYPPTYPSVGPSGLLLRLALIDHFRRVLADASVVDDPAVGVLGLRDPHAADPSLDGIVVDDATRWDPAIADAARRLLFGPSSELPQRQDVPTGGMFGPTPGIDVASYLILGQMTAFAIALNPQVAERIGMEAAEHLLTFGPQLGTCLGLQRLTVASMGPLSRLAGRPDDWAYPVTLVYSYFKSYAVEQEAPALKRIRFDSRLST